MQNKYFVENKYSLRQFSYEDKECILRFSMCDENKYQIYKMNLRNLKDFLKFAKKVENMPWKDIRKDIGLNYEALKNMIPPIYISQDIIMHSMRLSQKFRIIGYKEKEYFYMIWFDINHESC